MIRSSSILTIVVQRRLRLIGHLLAPYPGSSPCQHRRKPKSGPLGKPKCAKDLVRHPTISSRSRGCGPVRRSGPQSSYVDGPGWQALFGRVERFGRLRSYVRPVGAEHMSAGPDEVRRPRFPSRMRASCSHDWSGYSWSPVATVVVHHVICACQTRTQKPSVLEIAIGSYCAFANNSDRKPSPVLIMPQTIRASLLAMATVTSLAGFLARRATIQSRTGPVRLLTTFSSEVAGKYPPAKPGALRVEPPEAVGGVADAAPDFVPPEGGVNARG